MGYLIGGDDDAKPQQEIQSSGTKLSHLSDRELLELHEQTVKDVTKYSNFQQVRKICLNSLYGAIGNTYFRYYKLDNAKASVSMKKLSELPDSAKGDFVKDFFNQ